MEIMGYKDLKENLVIRVILENKDSKEMLERKGIKVCVLITSFVGIYNYKPSREHIILAIG